MDDDRELAAALVDFFRLEGFDAEGASNGREALLRTLEFRFDVILTDVRMPILDGHGMVEALKQRGDSTALLVMSSSQPDHGLQLFPYIPKPIDLDHLLEAVRSILDR